MKIKSSLIRVLASSTILALIVLYIVVLDNKRQPDLMSPGSFAVGTVVLTRDGPRAIESVLTGSQVHAWNPQTQTWSTREVRETLSHYYRGTVVTIRINTVDIVATADHHFFVIRGRDLVERSTSFASKDSKVDIEMTGRWIAAHRMQSGDVLKTLNGEETVATVETRPGALEVYNLEVAEDHTFAIYEVGAVVADLTYVAPEAELEEDRDSLSGIVPYTPKYGVKSDAETSAIEEEPGEPIGTMGKSDTFKPSSSASGLRAGFADDNQQFNHFIQFLRNYENEVAHLEINVEERIIIKALDRDGKSIPNALVVISAESQELCRGRSQANGSFFFFPSEYRTDLTEYNLSVTYNQQTVDSTIDRQSKRTVELLLDTSRPAFDTVALDLVFILDTTGSMGEEINRLKASLEIIYLNLAALPTKPDLRFGMVLYKDRGDEYVTKVVALTADLDRFQAALDEVSASGGGDAPEDLQAALRATIHQMNWLPNGIRLCFIITDAPPHLDYGQQYTYVGAAREAREKGLKIHSVGTGGLNLMGEYVLRQISQYTGGRYIFLTYGEQGESEGGAPGSVSHHTGANYETAKLETIIIRFAKEELQHLTDEAIPMSEDFFEAHKVDEEDNEVTLRKLLRLAALQLVDYSSLRLEKGTPTGVLPIVASTPNLSVMSEYLTEQFIFALKRDENLEELFRIVERKSIQQVLEELELQMSGLVDEKEAVRVGELLGAQVLFSGVLYEAAHEYQLFLRLLRVQTGEILSVTKAIVDKRLGI